MPLVTRTSVQGNIYRQAAVPGNWLNGDIWVDTDNGDVFVNVSGTARKIPANMTASRALVSDADGAVAVSATTGTELGYVNLVTSAIQTQLNNKRHNLTGGSSASIPSTETGFFGFAEGFNNATETIVDQTINQAFTVTRIHAIITANSHGAGNTVTVAFRDDAVDAGSVSVAGGVTGELDSSALTVAVATGSKCNFRGAVNVNDGGSATYRQIVVEIQDT